MRWYRWTWWAVVGALATPTFPIAMLVVPLSGLLSLLVLCGCVAASVSMAAAPTDMAMGDRIAQAGSRGVLAAAGAAVALGLVTVLGGAGLLIALLLTASSPFFTRRMYLRRAWLWLTTEAKLALDDEPLAPVRRPVPVTDLTTPELVRAWRMSYNSLFSAESTAALSAVVAQRQEYLEELERRDPAGLRRWLASGARAAGDPTRYLRDG